MQIASSNIVTLKTLTRLCSFVGLFFFCTFTVPTAFAGEENQISPASVLTVQQYADFLQATAATDSHALYNEKMEDELSSACILRCGTPGFYTYEAIPERGNDPVPYVSRLSAKRYCNWLQNGQPTGDQDETTTEQGAYALDGTMNEDPEHDEAATFFLSTPTNIEVDPSLSDNLTTYVVISHGSDCFEFSSTSSSENKEITSLKIIAGVIGAASLGIAFYDRGRSCYGECCSPQRTLDQRTDRIDDASARMQSAASTTMRLSEFKQDSLPQEPQSLMPQSQQLPAACNNRSSSSKKVTLLSESPIFFDRNDEDFFHLAKYAPISKSGPVLDSEEKVITANLSLKSREKMRIKQRKLIYSVLKEKIEALPEVSTPNQMNDRNFHLLVQENVEFFEQQSKGKDSQTIAHLRASQPSFFQDFSKRCWNHSEDYKDFLKIYSRKNGDPVTAIINKRTILLKLSDAIAEWHQNIHTLTNELISFKQLYVSNASLCILKQKLKNLSLLTFDHFSDFQNYMTWVTSKNLPLIPDTRTLVPSDAEKLMESKAAFDQWASQDHSTILSRLVSWIPYYRDPEACQHLITHLEAVQNTINTLSSLYRLNAEEALRFIEFKKEQEENFLKKRND